MKRIPFKKLSRLWKGRAGGVFVYFAIAAPVLIGIAGASIDVGLWYANKRLVQSAVDSAALAGALELRRTDETDADAIHADVETAVNLDAAINGYSAGNGDGIVVDTSNSPRVAVTITRPVPGLLSQVVFTEQTNVAARAVARADVNDSCIWSLNPSSSGAVTVQGAAQVDLACGVIANSSSGAGINENGTGCLNATEVKVVGGTGGDCINPTPGTGIDPVDDPLAALPAPSYSNPPCINQPPVTGNGPDPQYLNPGVYCNQLTINTTRKVIFRPGLYVLDGASLTISGSSDVEGTDVSFYLTENNDIQAENISIAGGATVILSAPSDGPLPGILFYHDRNAPTIHHDLTGGADMQLNGIIYFPTSELNFTGGSTLTDSASIIIADQVTFTGDVHLGDFDKAPGNAILGNALMLQATLVE
jgi:Flp pilus assembly protein TadG